MLLGYHPFQLKILSVDVINVSPIDLKNMTVGEVLDINYLVDFIVKSREEAKNAKGK